jgi:broad specificity polyphosphatase/5'/3'-nucleotidase SurE
VILATDDDGILSPGIVTAVESVQGLGDVLICASVSADEHEPRLSDRRWLGSY